MKRLMTILFAIGLITMSSTSMAGMSKGNVRKEAYFLTDKMSYELNMSVGQRNDAYEINYDFIYSVRNLMDNVLRGEDWAMNRYYQLLDVRNDDLRWVLNDRQYYQFMNVDYFYRPIYTSGSEWHFRIYISYSNHNHFYFRRPYHYTSYHFGHHRTHYNHASHYRGRYNHKNYSGSFSVRDRKAYDSHRRSDFSTVKARPNTDKPRQSVNSSSNRKKSPERGTSNRKPATVNSNKGSNNSSATGRTPNATTGRDISNKKVSSGSSSVKSSSVKSSSSSSSRSKSSSSGSSSRSSSSSSGSGKSSSRR